ncbi:MAG: M23 family metallopeptidase [Candidatus Promineifilaceae bacterium]
MKCRPYFSLSLLLLLILPTVLVQAFTQTNLLTIQNNTLIGFRTEDPGPFLHWPLADTNQDNITRLPDTPWTHNFLGISACGSYPSLLDAGYWPYSDPGNYSGNRHLILSGVSDARVKWMNNGDGNAFDNAFACYSEHAGIDISQADNTHVLAAASGYIHAISGTRYTIRHDNVNNTGQTWYTTYVHVTNMRYNIGTYVTAGTWIANVGSSHLHLETSYNGYYSVTDGRNPYGIDQSPWTGCLWLDQNFCPNQRPELATLSTPITNTWVKSTSLQCSPGYDEGIPDLNPNYRFQADNNSDFSSPEYDSGWGIPDCSTDATLATDANYYWRVNQSDGELNSGWTSAWLFKLDRAIPFANCIPSGTLGSNGWYVSNVNVACSAIDNTGTNNSGIATTSYKLNGVTQLSSFTATENRRNLVEFSATDNAGNSRMGSFFVNIDRTSPTITSMAINNGVSTTYSANVLLNNSAYDPPSNVNDLPSDLWQTCASLDQVNWSCTEYGTAMPFSLPNNNQTTHTVYFRVKDHAGNLSSVVSDSIFLDLYPALPSSSSYQMCGGTVAAAAGSASSTSYQQHQGVMGVPGSGYSESTSYQLFVGVPQNCHAAANSQNNYLPLVIAAP